ncbi:toprim domain-containing protein [Candidatus Micrarchaeota archaeon]|nr:toprim domain-containing protein [Candidatus Micrarchaeota archaeon]
MRKYPIKVSKLQHKAKLLKRTLEEIKDSLIIVEGKRDKEALKEISLNNVIAINANPNVAYKLQGYDEAIVLTDFDENGEELCLRLSAVLEANNIKPNLEIRRRLRYILGIKYIEEICTKIKEFEKELTKEKVN